MGNCGCFAGVTSAPPVDGKAPTKPEPVHQVEAEEKTPLVPATVPTPEADAPAPVHEPTIAPSEMPEPEPEKPAAMPEPDRSAVASTEEATRGAEMPEGTVVYSGAPEVGSCGVGSFMEVYSNSNQAWCPGVIYDMDSCSVLMAYQVPCEPSEAASDASIRIKTLTLDSPELRVASDTGPWLGADVEVFSHTNQDWCPGKINVIKDGVAEIAITYPGEEVPSIKNLQLGDKDIQLPGAKSAMQFSTGADGFAVGSPVEVYSNSLGMWCYGVIQQIVDGIASIAFYYPDMDPQNEAPAIKELPLGHPDFRLPTTASSIQFSAGVPESELLPGVAVEVYSESRQYWILGSVVEVKDGMVTVSLRYPDMPPDQADYEKVLPVGHEYLRLPLPEQTPGVDAPLPSS
eukprot:TRINITY_DN33468_c0_g1_i1.p1 TRINITY_DN33468_c0_g1~~TRINITY_DN33468_c0_g1_i1.p1  ORF type:complete len:402 (-),score=56.59 TRINITY_DN33468_c0_g1_i1:79-1284(-)